MENKPVGDTRIIREEGVINKLPDSLFGEILMNLPTKDVVKTSCVCRRWKYLWQSVPALDLVFNDSDTYSKYLFLNRFIDLNTGLCLKRVKLRYVGFDTTTGITEMIKFAVQHLDIESEPMYDKVEIPPTIYTSCDSLLSLKLCRVVLPKSPNSVSLPFLKMMDLKQIEFVDSLDLEMLISGCSALETLTMDIMYGVRVLSQSLLSLCLTRSGKPYRKTEGVMETPRLEYLKLEGQNIKRIIINDLSSTAKLDLVGLNCFDDKSIPSFLTMFSWFRGLICSASNLRQVTGMLSGLRKVLKFDNLCIKGMEYGSWECLLLLLNSTPNLKSLFMEFECRYNFGNCFLDLPRCVLYSLEFVEVKAEGRLVDMKKLWSYFIENARVLKKFTLCLDHIKASDKAILDELFKLPRRSETCEVVAWSRTYGTYKP